VIRTFPTFFLDRDIKDLREQQALKATKEP